jgi:hypothetical protein
MAAPDSYAAVPASSVSSVSPENDMANTSELAPTKSGSSYPFTTVTGTDMKGAAAATTTSPAIPLPPIPRTTTFSI